MKGYVERAPPTAEELFEATGGARFGMRAQSKQRGKWARSEGDAISDDVKNLVQVEWDGLGKVDVSDIVKKDQEKKKRRRKDKAETGEKKQKVERVEKVGKAENVDEKEDEKAKKDKKKKKNKKDKKNKKPTV